MLITCPCEWCDWRWVEGHQLRSGRLNTAIDQTESTAQQWHTPPCTSPLWRQHLRDRKNSQKHAQCRHRRQIDFVPRPCSKCSWNTWIPARHSGLQPMRLHLTIKLIQVDSVEPKRLDATWKKSANFNIESGRRLSDLLVYTLVHNARTTVDVSQWPPKDMGKGARPLKCKNRRYSDHFLYRRQDSGRQRDRKVENRAKEAGRRWRKVNLRSLDLSKFFCIPTSIIVYCAMLNN